MKFIRLVIAVVLATAYWWLTMFLGLILGGAGHGCFLFYQIAFFPFGAGLLWFVAVGLLLALPGLKYSKGAVIGLLCIQYGDILYLLLSGEVSMDGIVNVWRAIPGFLALNIACYAGVHSAIWTWLFRPKRAGA